MKASYPHTAMGSPGRLTPVSYSPVSRDGSRHLVSLPFILFPLIIKKKNSPVKQDRINGWDRTNN
jgi:hypothetical protein